MELQMLRWPDLFVMVVFLGVLVAIGAHFLRKNQSAEEYFLAGRDMPGWLVGFSVMATIVSAMTFLATPGFAFAEDWRYVSWSAGYVLAMIPAVVLFMPLFRRTGVSSAYEYLERRFGTWARLYSAAVFVLWLTCRTAIILYAISLPIVTMIDVDLPWIIVIFGVVVTVYSVAGGLEGVIWTELLQSVAMLLGGIICLPVLLLKLPGGFTRILTEAYADGKMSLGSTSFTFDEKTIWVMVALSLFSWLHWGCQDQCTVQRYCAPRNNSEAKKSLYVGGVLTIVVWSYFIFLGTAFYVFYKVCPDPHMAQVVKKPEQVFPYFVLQNVPAGLVGIVICGLVAAAMSTLSANMNAVSSAVTTDFYRRLLVRDRDEVHYMRAGRRISCVFGLIMIVGALIVHYTNTQTLQDLQVLIQSLSGGGLLALTLLGMLTVRVDSRAAFIAIGTGSLIVCGWLFLDSAVGRQWFPVAASSLPDMFWVHVFVNLFVFGLGYGLSFVLRSRHPKKLAGLTIWTADMHENNVVDRSTPLAAPKGDAP